MAVALAPRTQDFSQSAFRLVSQVSIGVTITVIWAVRSNIEVVESLTTIVVETVLWSKGPGNTGSVGPLEVITITAWVADGDEMPVIGITSINVLSALKVETNLPDVWHFNLHVRQSPVNDIGVPLTPWTLDGHE